MQSGHKSEFEKKLIGDPLKQVLGFFKMNDLHHLSQVSKSFNKLTHEYIHFLKQQYKNNVFYTVGKPIHIFQGRSCKPRKQIPDSEMYNSFFWGKEQKLKLFKNIAEACEYSRSLRTGGGYIEEWTADTVTQPAVFTVIFVGNINNITMLNENLIINKGTHCNLYDLHERTTPISYFETNRSSLIALYGSLYVHHLQTREPTAITTVNFAQKELTKENDAPTHSHKICCAIS